MNYWFSLHLQYSPLSFSPRDIFDWYEDGKMSERQKEGEKKLIAYGTSNKCAPHWSAELQRMDAVHHGMAMVPPSQMAMNKKRKCKVKLLLIRREWVAELFIDIQHVGTY